MNANENTGRNRTIRSWRRGVMLLCLLALTACSGGGGGDGGNGNTEPGAGDANRWDEMIWDEGRWS